MSDCNKVLVFVILGIIIYFFIIQPIIDNMCKNDVVKIKEKLANLDDLNKFDSNNIMKIDNNVCSKQCCKYVQWPVPNEFKTNDMSATDASKYVSSNFSCNSGKGSGCLCVTKENINNLVTRGANTNNNVCNN